MIYQQATPQLLGMADVAAWGQIMSKIAYSHFVSKQVRVGFGRVVRID